MAVPGKTSLRKGAPNLAGRSPENPKRKGERERRHKRDWNGLP